MRRFEDKSGHLTAAGKKRYDDYDYDKPKKKLGIFARMRQNRDERNELRKTMGQAFNKNASKTGSIHSKEMEKIGQDYEREMNSDRMRLLRAEAKNAHRDYEDAMDDSRYWGDRYVDSVKKNKKDKYGMYPIGDHLMSEMADRAEADAAGKSSEAYSAYMNEYKKIATKYVDKVKNQTLKELNFKDVERGKALMDKHNMWGEYYHFQNDYSDPHQ